MTDGCLVASRLVRSSTRRPYVRTRAGRGQARGATPSRITTPGLRAALSAWELAVMRAATMSSLVNGSSGPVRCWPLYIAGHRSIGHVAGAASTHRLGDLFAYSRLLQRCCGLAVGLVVYAPTAPFAAFELGFPAALAGGVVGLVAGMTAATAFRVRRHAVRLEAPGSEQRPKS